MKRAVHLIRELLIGCDSEKHVAGFHRDLVVTKTVVLEDPNMVERAFDQRLGARFAIFFEQVLLEASCINPDPDRAAVRPRRGDDFLTRSSEPMLPGLIRRHAAPASAASSARL